jgi:hypothetical protein
VVTSGECPSHLPFLPWGGLVHHEEVAFPLEAVAERLVALAPDLPLELPLALDEVNHPVAAIKEGGEGGEGIVSHHPFLSDPSKMMQSEGRCTRGDSLAIYYADDILV